MKEGQLPIYYFSRMKISINTFESFQNFFNETFYAYFIVRCEYFGAKYLLNCIQLKLIAPFGFCAFWAPFPSSDTFRNYNDPKGKDKSM